MSRQCVIGVDLGGTNVRAGAFFEDGSSAGQSYSNPSNAQQGTEAIVSAIALTVMQAAKAAEIPPTVIGLAVPGHIDDAKKMVVWAPNFGHEEEGVFRYWTDVPLGSMLEDKLGMEVHMGNDANLAALGEYRFGSGRNKADCLVMLTIGTGIGGGVVMSPKSVQGSASGPLVLLGGNKGGAELGHIIVAYGGLDCNAGTYGALEGYCQRDSIITRAQHRLRRGRKSILQQKNISRITPLDLTEAANQGDALAIEVWDEVGEMLGAGIGTLINVFAPDVFAIGGQIAKAGDWLLKPALRTAENVAVPSLFRDAKIQVAEQIEDAGMLGGAALALETIHGR